MKNKKIKVFFGINYNNVKNTFPIKVLVENFNTEKVFNPENADLIIDPVRKCGRDYSKLKNKKILVFANDNLNFKKNLFSFIESVAGKIGTQNKKHKIMDKLDLLIPKKISSVGVISFFREYERVISRKQKNEFYFITTNKLKQKNSISIPLFISVYYDKLKSLLNKNSVSNRKKFCAFVVSSNSSRERVDFFKKLSKYKKVDSYGKVMNNVDTEKIGKDWRKNSDIFKKYKFVICFENSFADDYITEKLLNVMFAGVIPIYRGAPNVGEYFNTKSFVNYENYGSYDKMVEKIIELDKDDKKYRKMRSEPWFKDNKVPEIIKKKKKELIKFYEKVLGETLR